MGSLRDYKSHSVTVRSALGYMDTSRLLSGILFEWQKAEGKRFLDNFALRYIVLLENPHSKRSHSMSTASMVFCAFLLICLSNDVHLDWRCEYNPSVVSNLFSKGEAKKTELIRMRSPLYP